MFTAIITLLRIVSILMNHTYIVKGRRREIQDELLRIFARVGVTREIVKQIDSMSEDEIDDELRN